MGLSEVAINKFSQLVYLDVVAGMGGAGSPTVGQLCDYYSNDPTARLYIGRRFGSLPLEEEGWRMFLRSGVDDILDFRIVDIMDDNGQLQSGFYGCSYQSPTGERVTAFRGSEMLGNRRYKNDYTTDFALSWAAKTPQQKLVDSYLDTYGRSSRPYYLTGHSLGGNLAVYGAVNAPTPGKLLGCYAFNAPGFNRDFVKDNRQGMEAASSKLYLYQNKHDLVSSMLEGIGSPIVIDSLYHPLDQENLQVGDLFYPHSNFMFQRRGEHFVREPDGQKDPLCGLVQEFTLGFLQLPGVVKKAVSQLLLTALYSEQSPEKQVSYALEAITKLYMQNGVPDTGPNGFAASSATFLAKQLWQQPKSNGERYKGLLQQGGSKEIKTAETGILLLHMLQFALTGRCCGRG